MKITDWSVPGQDCHFAVQVLKKIGPRTYKEIEEQARFFINSKIQLFFGVCWRLKNSFILKFPWYINIFTVLMRVTVTRDVSASYIGSLNNIMRKELSPCSKSVGCDRIFFYSARITHSQRNFSFWWKRTFWSSASRRLTSIAIVCRC